VEGFRAPLAPRAGPCPRSRHRSNPTSTNTSFDRPSPRCPRRRTGRHRRRHPHQPKKRRRRQAA